MLSVLIEFSMFPTSSDGREGASVSKSVSKIIDMIDKLKIIYVDWTDPKTLIIDNWRVLHGRQGVIEKDYKSRVIERLQVFI